MNFVFFFFFLIDLNCFMQTQASSLRELELSLKEYGVQLVTVYSDTLHDREIRFGGGSMRFAWWKEHEVWWREHEVWWREHEV